MNQDGEWENFPPDDVLAERAKQQELINALQVRIICHLCNEPVPKEELAFWIQGPIARLKRVQDSMCQGHSARSKLGQPRAAYWGSLALGLMGKVSQQSSMLQCFALAIWWSY